MGRVRNLWYFTSMEFNYHGKLIVLLVKRNRKGADSAIKIPPLTSPRVPESFFFLIMGRRVNQNRRELLQLAVWEELKRAGGLESQTLWRLKRESKNFIIAE